MNEHHLTAMTRSLSSMPSRRDIVRGLMAIGLGLGVAQAAGVAEAKKKRRKKKKQKVKPNAYGCLSVGVTCKSPEQCCSGICEGQKCRAHDTGVCKQGVPGVCTASLGDLPLLACHGARCFCYRTTAGSNFCTAGTINDGSSCADCTKDADCLALGHPAGSACVPVPQSSICGGVCDGGMACMHPCDYEQ